MTSPTVRCPACSSTGPFGLAPAGGGRLRCLDCWEVFDPSASADVDD